MSNNSIIDADSMAREKIISEIKSNFFVEAGAGSGKTTMLVNRMVAMVEEGIPIEKISAITFTKAAAGEFYNRFQKLLIQRSNPNEKWENKGYAGQLPKPTPESMKLCSEALVNIDLCFMGTIDSFCNMVLSEHPSEANIPSDAKLMSDADVDTFIKQKYVDICNGELGDKLKKEAQSFRAFYYDAEDVFVKGIRHFMSHRNVHYNYNHLSDFNVDIDTKLASDREKLLKALKLLLEHPEEISETNQGTRDAKEALKDVYKALDIRWSDNMSNVLYNMKSVKGLRVLHSGYEQFGVTLGDLFQEEHKAKDKSHLINIGEENGTYSKLLNMQYDISMSFLFDSLTIIVDALRASGYMAYFDYLYYLRNMLKSDAKGDGRLIEYINKRHSYFLIDEFQDTNPLQSEIFFYLTATNPNPSWIKCVPKDGSLFIVGDPKQSIYRFRGADVASFLRVKRLFEDFGGEVVELSRNFRSTRTLCEHYNKFFKEMLKEETEEQSKFTEIPLPEKTVDEFQGVYTYQLEFQSEEDENEKIIIKDAEQIYNIINVLVDNEDYLIAGEEDKELRKIRYSDFMIITGSKTPIASIVECFENKGVPVRVEGNVPFERNEALIEVYKIYATVANYNDIVALYGALTGRLIGITKEEIKIYEDEGGKLSLFNKTDKSDWDDKSANKVASAIEDLAKFYNEARGMSPAALLSAIMEKFRVYEVVASDNLEVMYYTLEILRNAERTGLVITLSDGAAYLNKLITGQAEEERCLSLSGDRDAVHIANLHKIKGLEAPIVILSKASTGSIPSDETNRIIYGDDKTEGYMLKLPKERKKVYFESPNFTEIKNQEKESEKLERDRCIYVAATRARNALIMYDKRSKKGEKISHAYTLWNKVFDDDTPDFFEATGNIDLREIAKKSNETFEATKLYNMADASCVLNDRSNEEQTYTIELPSKLRTESKVSKEADSSIYDSYDDVDGKEDAIKDIEAHKYPTVLGTSAHKLMEMLVSSHNSVNIEVAVKEIVSEYSDYEMESYKKTLISALTNLGNKMRSGGYKQSNGVKADILNELINAKSVFCEAPFCYREDTPEGKVLWNGVMDVVYQDDAGWHIIDYKTNMEGDNLDVKYKNQLDAYIKAFKEATGEDADAKVYHIDI